jgi:hypothetical protein
MLPNRVFILGGGSSIRQNQWSVPISQLPLWSWLKGEFVINTNYGEKFFSSTAMMYSDYQFYYCNKEWIDNVLLVIGKEDGYYRREGSVKLGNNVLLTKDLHFQLIGIAAIDLAIKLGIKEIFLLGFDSTEIDGHTHYYDDTNIGTYVYNNRAYCGIGKHENGKYKTGNYNNIDELNNVFMGHLKTLPKGIKVSNVSPESKISIFPKMNYNQLYSYLNHYPIVCDQDEIRKEIKKGLE